ncbi:LOG family protein [Nocardioides albus]|uniref:SLOG cluster 4 domain-containing protein n=1 Tax=Nocardioides albus TaxID=1841 RepID=UPI0019AC3A06|nr:LOG family protein [Nocardioides albus]GGU46263.1 hypothetical protein GCM10007979_51790 [Nocardioides albus]
MRSRHCTDRDRLNALEVGRLLAENGATVLNGGGVGVMEAVSEGAHVAGGLVVGVRPGPDSDDANDYLDVVLATNMGESRNAILIWSPDAVIVIGGSPGTLSELALGMHRPVPVITLGGWKLTTADGEPVPNEPPTASTPEEAVQLALSWTTGKKRVTSRNKGQPHQTFREGPPGRPRVCRTPRAPGPEEDDVPPLSRPRVSSCRTPRRPGVP